MKTQSPLAARSTKVSMTRFCCCLSSFSAMKLLWYEASKKWRKKEALSTDITQLFMLSKFVASKKRRQEKMLKKRKKFSFQSRAPRKRWRETTRANEACEGFVARSINSERIFGEQWRFFLKQQYCFEVGKLCCSQSELGGSYGQWRHANRWWICWTLAIRSC